MGPQEDYIEAVVTCEGDFHDPKLQDRLQRFQQRLESLLLEGELAVRPACIAISVGCHCISFVIIFTLKLKLF